MSGRDPAQDAALQHPAAPRVPATDSGPRGGHGAWSRLSIGARVAVATILALAATVLATWIAERSALRWRVDLTAEGENTLHPATSKVVSELPREIAVDLFLSPPDAPFQLVGREAQERVRRLARLMSDAAGGRLSVEDHDLSDRARLDARTQARRVELDILSIEPGGLVVVSAGGRRELLRLRGDLADLDPGNADPRQGPVTPPRIAGFRGEEALLAAILEVSEERRLRAVFTRGHGEIDLESQGERGAARLASELTSGGFRVTTWDQNRGDAFPEDADVAVVLGAEQPFTPGEFDALASFVERGGRLLVALAPRQVGSDSGVESLLARFGIAARPGGIVATPMPSASGAPQTGIPQCAIAVVGAEGMPAQNPITDPLRGARQRVMLYASRAFDRSPPPRAARVLELLRSAPESWLEAPLDSGDGYDFVPDATSVRASFALAMQVVFPPASGTKPVAAGDPARPESRVLALGSVDALANHLLPTNRDFVVNAFDWLASREYRVRVDTRERQARRLDLSDPRPVSRVHTIGVLVLPGLCLGLGLLTWRRRRSTR